jgi:hypothetical protein
LKKEKKFGENGSNDSVRLHFIYVANPFGRVKRLLIVQRLNGVVSPTSQISPKITQQQNFIKPKEKHKN